MSSNRVCHFRGPFRRILWLLLLLGVTAPSAFGQFLRVVSYNVMADANGNIGQIGGPNAGPGLNTVLQAIGNAHLAGNAQPIDVLALQELNGTPGIGTPSVTLDFIASQLNGIYGAGTYKADTVVDATTGSTFTGNGPSGLIYNTKTVQLLGAAVIGSASGSGAPRAPMRYKLAPFGYDDHSADFYLYTSHMKSGSTGSGPGSNGDRRNIEAKTIRTNAATLGASAHIIYSGDLNLNGSFEDAYQTMISASITSGVGKAIDTLNPANNWDTSSTFKALLTEEATSVTFRDDFQLVTNQMISASPSDPGMKLVSNSLIAFGNGGGIYHQSVTNSANSAAFPDLGQAPFTPAYRSSVLTALTTTTDHLPVVADYSFVSAVGIPGDYDHSGVVTAADYDLWRSTFGSTTKLAADGNQNGVVDAADFAVWRDHFASGVGAGAEEFATTAVPEPGTAVLLVLGVCWLVIRPGTLREWTRKS